MRNLASPDTDLGRVRARARGRRRRGRARRPAAGPALRRPRDAPSAPSPPSRAPSSRRRSPSRPRPRTPRSATLPVIRPLLKNTAGLFADLRPGFAALCARSPTTSCGSVTVGVKALRISPELQRPARPDRAGAARLQQQRQRPRGPRRPRRLLRPGPAAARPRGPAQSVCNYATLLFRNVANHLASATGSAPGSASSRSRRRRARTARAAPASHPANGGGEPRQLPARQPVPEHGLARPVAARVRGRQRDLRRRPGGDRQRARRPGDHHRGARLHAS